MKKLLIFGGTTEGRELCQIAVETGFAVTVCVATQYGCDCLPENVAGLTVRTGRLDMAQMCSLMHEDFSCVIDATHPYAVAVGENIRQAATQTNLAYLRLLREESAHDGCLYADSVAEACAMAPEGNVLAATGSKEIAAYTAIENYQARVYARVLPMDESFRLCRATGLSDDHILAAKGPFSLEENMETLRRYNIRVMITKDGGKAGGFPEKLEAARACGVQLILVRRPKDSGLSMGSLRSRLEAMV